ncbi:Hypothetical protein CINCED_3A018787 [Cinara cedri]|uniref:Uncharacterized protein n=1 Tax=Cinara cedri TaxID=506608 RepID=A0A5E4M318_9HEMI|nr:Hypothetical protein CINCED_3A018787 [Cinara cedri]
MSPKNVMLLVLACLVNDAFYTDAAPTSDLTVFFPRSLVELVSSDSFEQVWRDAAADQLTKRFGRRRDDGGQQPLPTRNMVGDYIVSDEFQQAVCKGANQGMTSMGGMMSNAPAPWSFMGTFIGSEKFNHGCCDMMSQGMIQFGQGMNNYFARSAPAEQEQDPLLALDEFFRSEHYGTARERLRTMFSDVQF